MSMIHAASPTTQTELTNLDEACVQQNAVDLRIKSIRWIKPTMFTIDEENKQHRETMEIPLDEEGYWNLDPGSYEITTDHIIKMGDAEAGFVITRSTLNRNGVFITSGNYDSGYHGAMAGCMHVTTGPMRIKPGTRVGQMLLWKAEALSQYDGSYGFTKDGVIKKDEEKYHK